MQCSPSFAPQVRDGCILSAPRSWAFGGSGRWRRRGHPSPQLGAGGGRRGRRRTQRGRRDGRRDGRDSYRQPTSRPCGEHGLLCSARSPSSSPLSVPSRSPDGLPACLLAAPTARCCCRPRPSRTFSRPSLLPMPPFSPLREARPSSLHWMASAQRIWRPAKCW